MMDDNTFWSVIIITTATYYTIKHILYIRSGREF